ncbi:Crp/Fnr family transcriptional regulator [Actinomadura atramentaria]|uniref:Crp/Fnr family transcriptional regulator n=1 Tax=Actinomadura atramentaria TaxID=1990 RepID=UPI00146BCFA6|nr:Crp/Fnr family transcriptional regulator [Actinomadura atramentaria]
MNSSPEFSVFTRLLERSRTRNLRSGEVLFREGDHGTLVGIVLKGQVKIWRATINGSQDVLAFRSERDLVGRTAVLDGKVRTATVEAQVRSRVALVPGSVYLDVLQASNLRVGVERDIRKRVDESRTVRGLDPSIARLAYAFTTLLDRRIADTPGSPRTVILHSSRADLARYLGIGRNRISRLLVEMGSVGVRASHAQIEIQDSSRLREMARSVRVSERRQ